MTEERLYTQAEVDELVAYANTYSRGRCRICHGQPGGHRMYCKHYKGPLRHTWVSTRLNPTFGGIDWNCSCGGYVRIGDMFDDGDPHREPVCPRVNEVER